LNKAEVAWANRSEQQLLIPMTYIGQLNVLLLLNDGVVERQFQRLGQKSDGMVTVSSELSRKSCNLVYFGSVS
jgi:Pyruvate/2-oxoacid:ferredoxin oxidoreductase gamma subunit